MQPVLSAAKNASSTQNIMTNIGFGVFTLNQSADVSLSITTQLLRKCNNSRAVANAEALYKIRPKNSD